MSAASTEEQVFRAIARIEQQRDDLADAGRGVLLVLSLLQPEISRMGCHASQAVEKFRPAMVEATGAAA